jgi:hypothetical protein
MPCGVGVGARLVVNRVHWRGRMAIRRSSWSRSSGERSSASVVFATRVRPAETKSVSRLEREKRSTRVAVDSMPTTQRKPERRLLGLSLASLTSRPRK